MFHCTANTALETGAPILCHIESGSDPFDVIDFYTKKGIKASSIILCHLDRAKYDLDYHREIAAACVYLEYDTIGRLKYHSDEKEADLIAGMVESGFKDMLLVGLDTARERLKSYGGAIGLDYIKNEFVPKLVSMGVDINTIEEIAVKTRRGH